MRKLPQFKNTRNTSYQQRQPHPGRKSDLHKEIIITKRKITRMEKFSLNLRKIVVTTWFPNLMDWKTKLVVGGSSCRWHKTVRLTFVLNAVNYIRLTLLLITFFINFIT